MWYEELRSEIPTLKTCIYLNTGTVGPSPDRVTDRFLYEYRQWEQQGPGNPRNYEAMHWDRLVPFREALASMLEVSPGELALTANATDGVNIVAWGKKWVAGDEVVIGNQEHPAVFVPWLHQQRIHGLRVRYLPYANDAQEFLSGLDSVLTSRTRLVVLSHVSSQTGLVIPAREVVRKCHSRGVEVMLDGAQAVGQVPVNIDHLGCDYYTLNGHKWCLGPVGTGALFVREDKLEELMPSWVGGGSTLPEHTDFETGSYRFRPTAQRYEFATRNWPLYLGWQASLRALSEAGWGNIWTRTAQLATRLQQGIKSINGLQLLSPKTPSRLSGLVAVRISNLGAEEAVDRLIDEFSIVTRPVRELDAVRISCAFFNTEQEIDQALECLEQLALG